MTVWVQRRVADLIDGLTAGVSVRSTGGGTSGPSVLKTSAIDAGRFDPRESKAILPDDLSRARCPVTAGSMIVSRMNTPALVGDVGYVAEDYDDLYLPDRLWLARPKRGSDTDMRWLTYLFASQPGAHQLRGLATGTSGSMKNIPKDRVLNLEIVVPSVPEQHAIADALGDADDLITTLERLITKKQAIKQGMMQQLLTGRTRLPAFSESWTETQAGNLLQFKNGLNKGSEYFGAGTPIVNFMDVMNGPIIEIGDVVGRVTLTRDEIKRFSARKGDLFFTRTSETVDEVGTAAVLVDDIADACFSGFVLRGRPKSADVEPRFLARAFQLDTIRAQVMSSATYTTRALTNGGSLGKVVLDLPSIDEQRAIARVFDDSDAEIEVLRTRLGKSRAVKIGMLQQLLTGRVRLPLEAAS